MKIPEIEVCLLACIKFGDCAWSQMRSFTKISSSNLKWKPFNTKGTGSLACVIHFELLCLSSANMLFVTFIAWHGSSPIHPIQSHSGLLRQESLRDECVWWTMCADNRTFNTKGMPVVIQHLTFSWWLIQRTVSVINWMFLNQAPLALCVLSFLIQLRVHWSARSACRILDNCAFCPSFVASFCLGLFCASSSGAERCLALHVKRLDWASARKCAHPHFTGVFTHIDCPGGVRPPTGKPIHQEHKWSDIKTLQKQWQIDKNLLSFVLRATVKWCIVHLEACQQHQDQDQRRKMTNKTQWTQQNQWKQKEKTFSMWSVQGTNMKKWDENKAKKMEKGMSTTSKETVKKKWKTKEEQIVTWQKNHWDKDFEKATLNDVAPTLLDGMTDGLICDTHLNLVSLFIMFSRSASNIL